MNTKTERGRVIASVSRTEMARPKEKPVTSTAFEHKCLAASDKLASFQATTLKDDIER